MPQAIPAALPEPLPLDRAHAEALCRAAGADDVAFLAADDPAIAAQRPGLNRALAGARAVAVFVRRLNRHALRAQARNLSSAEFQAGVHDVNDTIHKAIRAFADENVPAVGISGLFPFDFGATEGTPFLVQMKLLAEAAGLGLMGKNRMVLHPRFGPDHYIGAIVLGRPVSAYDRRLEASPCINCNLCAVACPTGAIARDGHFDFGSCMTHNYREKTSSFVEWVHTIADARNRADYRRKVSDGETQSWWQSLGYEANTHCDYCVAVCPAGEEVQDFLADRKRHFAAVVKPLRERTEPVYVVPGSDAEAYVARAFPHKRPRRIGSGRRPASVGAMVRMMPITFQRGRAQGLDARYHLSVHGAETMQATLEIRDQKILVQPGLAGAADLAIDADAATWLALVAGEARPFLARLKGRLRLKGRPALLGGLLRCFPV